MYSEGAFGSGSEPSANLMAISHEPAAEKYNSDEEAFSISCALELSLCSADRPQRKTFVSSRHFTRSSWLSRGAFSCGLRTDRAGRRAKERQNHPGCCTAREEYQDCSAPCWQA